ncbi:MAG TPA: metallophosphoesterase [Polyangia bacterium]|nr:metallophosphoesterase [Polyangia bacterium]
MFAAVILAGCGGAGSGRAVNVLCAFCTDDSQCGGNPCFEDASGGRFCGRPCDDGCPQDFSCIGIAGTGGAAVQSCFPNNQSCMQTPVVNSTDMAGAPPQQDGSVATHDAPPPCTPPAGGTVSISGGTVDRLYFGYTGDTRDSSSTSQYSSQLQSVINNIYTRMAANGVEFAIDGGDHMEASSASAAKGNLQSYANAAALLGKPVFMTMGNHECENAYNSQDCGFAGAETSDFKMAAFLAALKQVSGADTAYYRFDVQTNAGKAVFLIVADDAWNATEQSWLTTQLTDADANAKYTFVIKHHPDGNTDQPAFQQIYNLVRSHKYTLFLTGHSHEYKHQWNDNHAVVMGLGGAPFDNPNQQWWGYLTVMQCPDNTIHVAVYDQATGNVQDTWQVGPQ